MKKIIFFILFTTACQYISAQSVGIGTNNPQTSALLDVTSTTKGILVPRMTSEQRTAIAAPVLGLFVFDNTTRSFWFYNGAPWTELITTSNTGWGLTGNSGAIDGSSFIGTTTNVPLNFRQNNISIGRLDAVRNNVFLGDHAGFAHFGIGVGRNTFIGFEAGYSATTASENTFVGSSAGRANTNATGNTMIGNDAGLNNTASNNIFIGHNSGALNTTGTDNVFVGQEAGLNNSSGIANTFTGRNAGKLNTSGEANTAFGFRALYSNTFGYRNTAIGYLALESNNGNFNTAVGNQSLYQNVSGHANTAIGYRSLGISTDGVANTAIGDQTLVSKSSGNQNTAVGQGALSNLLSGNNNIGLGHHAEVPNANGSNQMRLGNTEIVTATIQVPLSVSSDKRWKSNIQTSALGLDFIMNLHPVSYYRNNDISQKSEYGFIAQELDETLRSFGATDNGIISKDHEGMYNVRYNDLLAPMVKAIQEQQTIIDNQQKQIDELKSLLNKLAKGKMVY